MDTSYGDGDGAAHLAQASKPSICGAAAQCSFHQTKIENRSAFAIVIVVIIDNYSTTLPCSPTNSIPKRYEASGGASSYRTTQSPFGQLLDNRYPQPSPSPFLPRLHYEYARFNQPARSLGSRILAGDARDRSPGPAAGHVNRGHFEAKSDVFSICFAALVRQITNRPAAFSESP
jgi:hypothetical protein